MEYLIKASAIIAVFYMVYKLLLQRDTFFQSNRWFLLAGLLVALTIPMVVIPIYIEYTPIDTSNFTFENAAIAHPVNTGLELIDYAMITYGLGVAFFFTRFIIQITSLALVILKNKKEERAKYTYVKTQTDLSPFSFFKWIVYNPEQFNETELEQIIAHEKVHANQYHSVDILLTHLACIALWFNPFIWLYNKYLKQNLEFIADNIAQSKFNSKNYQTTLLKTSVPTHQLALSNNFYNSLIKKRIIMLNKSRSIKINQLKYALVIPLLALFLMSFNTEDVYIDQASEKILQNDSTLNTTFKQNNIDTYHILDTFKDEDFKDMKKLFASKEYTLKISNLKRSQTGLITAISISIKNKTANANFSTSSGLPIKAIKIVLNNDENNISIGNLSSSDWKVVTGFPSQEKADLYKESKKIKNIFRENELKIALFVLNGKEVNKSDIENLNAEDIGSINVLKNTEATKKYGNKGKNGVVEITTKESEWKTHFIEGKTFSDVEVVGYSDAKPTEGIKIKITNTTSSNGEDPIYILDGKEITKEELQKLDPNKIESISVFKDKKATDLYGDKGKHGVVEITSKDNSKWKVTAKRNKNVIFATRDTIYVNKKPTVLREVSNSFEKQPLYILDGKEITKKELDLLDEQTINSLSSVKGEQAIKEFGEKGENGVIIIKSRILGSRNNSYIKTVEASLYIVDGKEVKKEEFENIYPENIKSMNVLKGESATKKYGDKGENGVIEIITKE